MAWLGRFRTAAARWAEAGLDVLFPPRCAICGDDVAVEAAAWPRGAVTCRSCAALLVGADARCRACGAPVGGAGCRACRGRPPWDGIVVLGSYADELRTAVLRAKRPAGERVAAALAGLLVRHHRDALVAWGPDVVVPVPMHWLRRMTRGTSAADEIARGVAAGLGGPCRRLLRRARATPMQNTLPVADRHANVRGAFRGRTGLAGLRVLIVDDVTTTGSTLAACAEAAISAGAAAVYAAAVARADAGGTSDP